MYKYMHINYILIINYIILYSPSHDAAQLYISLSVSQGSCVMQLNYDSVYGRYIHYMCDMLLHLVE